MTFLAQVWRWRHLIWNNSAIFIMLHHIVMVLQWWCMDSQKGNNNSCPRNSIQDFSHKFMLGQDTADDLMTLLAPVWRWRHLIWNNSPATIMLHHMTLLSSSPQISFNLWHRSKLVLVIIIRADSTWFLPLSHIPLSFCACACEIADDSAMDCGGGRRIRCF